MMSSEPQNDNKEPEVSRFSRDGIVAEMVVEVDEENESISSPSKTLKLNGLDKCSKMSESNFKKCSVVLDTKKDLDEMENSGTVTKNENQLPQEETRNESDGDKEDLSDGDKGDSSDGEKGDKSDKDEGDEDKVNESDEAIEDESDEAKGNESDEAKENKSNEEEKPEVPKPDDLEKDSATVQEKTESDEEKESCGDEDETKDMDVEEKLDPLKTDQEEDIKESSKKLTPPTKVVQSRVVRMRPRMVKPFNKTENTRKSALRSQLKAKVEETVKSKTKILKSPVKNEGNKSTSVNAGKKPKTEGTATKSNTKISESSVKKEEIESAPAIIPKKRGRKRKVDKPEVKPEEKKVKSDFDEKITRASNRLSAVKKTDEKVKSTAIDDSEISTPTGKRTRSGNLPLTVPEKSKKTPLGKTTVRKSTMAAKLPKHYSLNRFGNTTLGGFPHINHNIQTADWELLKLVYQLLFTSLPNPVYKESTIRRHILKFSGLHLDRNSSELTRRRRFLKTKTPFTVSHICNTMGITLSSKYNMITDLITFLLKPAQTVKSVVDPFHPSMQPVVKLEEMALDKTYLSLILKEDAPKSPALIEKSQQPFKRKSITLKAPKRQALDEEAPKRHALDEEAPTVKRKRFPSTKLDIYVSGISRKSSTSEKESTSSANTEREQSSRTTPNTGKESSKNSTGKVGTKGTTQSLIARKKLVKLAMKGRKTRPPVKVTSVEESENPTSASEQEIQIKTEPMIESYYEVNVSDGGDTQNEEGERGASAYSGLTESSDNFNRHEDSDSDSTLSSDEMKEQANKDLDGDLWIKRGKTSILGKMDSSTKRVTHKRYGKPLCSFPKIKENIMSADYKALLRVHILLFGASDKAEKNVKGNILAFGGFPFLEGSEEWKQKEFLLSLLAQNNLQEYMTLLCIEHSEDDDIPTMIKKLMKFLAAPTDKNEKSPEETIRTQVVSSEPVDYDYTALYEKVRAERERKLAIKKAEAEKKQAGVESRKAAAAARKAQTLLRKAEEKNKKPPRPKKVLMDEEQVRRLEADLAREQRILERERKLQTDEARKRSPYAATPTPPNMIEAQSKNKATRVAMAVNQADNELLVALLQTVYKRRALKKAGAKISIPNKGEQIRLGELANVQFLVLTANYNDLDVLHHLIFMNKANKARVRKNILEFAGFNFTEDCPAYKDRMNFLESLGYDISRRIAFLLGLCPFKTPIDKRDLNELIMYFLMAPCQSKQIPIRVYPEDMFSTEGMPHELDVLVKKHGSISDEEPSPQWVNTAGGSQLQISVAKSFAQKPVTASPKKAVAAAARKAVAAAPSKAVATPSPRTVATPPQGGVGTPMQKAKKSFKSSCRPSILKKSAPAGTLKQLTPVATTPSSRSIVLPGLSHSTTPILKSHTVQQGLMRIPFQSGTIAVPPTSPSQELYIQQEAPDGTKKTYKLVKLPSSPLMNQALRLPATAPQLIAPKITQPVTVSSPVVHSPLPPGLIIFKNNNPTLGSHQVPKVLQTAPLVLNQPELSGAGTFVSSDADTSKEDVELDEGYPITSVECRYEEDEAEEMNPLEDPSDDELYMSIQEIIHDSNFEHITLQNVIDRVSAQYSAFDLADRRAYMKDCVRKIIMGT